MNPVNVLSLFDGCSCGQLALQRAEIPVSNYYASELDKHAIAVTMKNFPNTLQIGDVRNVKASDLPKIDLLIGGSPCQGFSSSGKRLNFDDPRSALFFEYVRILKELREINPDIKFLLENVKMKKEWVAVISEILGVEPVEINSALVSAQNRKRLYWANFYISQPADRGILLKDILEDGDTVAGMRGRYLNEDGTRDDVARPKIVQCIENRLDGKSNTLTTVSKDNLVFVGHTGKSKRTNGNTVRAYRQGERIFVVNGKNPTLSAQMGGTANGTGLITEDLLHYRNLTITECERLQTMPDGYTSVAPKTARTKMIGNGWTIDVITHILNFLKSNLQNQF
jgi:DNA (cytosine-5)-methyltransferase 3A